MRTISLILLLFSSTALFAQKKKCSFAYRSITRPNSKNTQKLIETIDTLHLKTCYQTEEIPDFIINTLECWTGYDWSIANAGSPYYETGIKGPEPLPTRQLRYMGLNEHYMLIAYIHGGSNARNCPVLLFRFEDKKCVSVMYWASANDEIKTKEDVMSFLKSYEKKDRKKVPVI